MKRSVCLSKTLEMELEDTSIDMQTFALNRGEGTTLKLVLDEFTDFYGHITIYRLEVWGLDRPLGTYKNHMSTFELWFFSCLLGPAMFRDEARICCRVHHSSCLNSIQ